MRAAWPVKRTTRNLLVSGSGLADWTMSVMLTSRMFAGWKGAPASGVYVNTGTAVFPGNMDGYPALMVAICAAVALFITLSRYGIRAAVVAATGSAPPPAFRTTARISVVPCREYRTHCTPLPSPRSASVIRSYGPGTVQVASTVHGTGGR